MKKKNRRPQASEAITILSKPLYDLLKLQSCDLTPERLFSNFPRAYIHVWASLNRIYKDIEKHLQLYLPIVTADSSSYKDDPRAVSHLKETIERIQEMIKVATVPEMKSSCQMRAWITRSSSMRLSGERWIEKGKTSLSVVADDPTNRRGMSRSKTNFMGYFHLFRLGLIRLVSDAFFVTETKKISDAEYFIIACYSCHKIILKKNIKGKFCSDICRVNFHRSKANLDFHGGEKT